jgi:hypothetical protein
VEALPAGHLLAASFPAHGISAPWYGFDRSAGAGPPISGTAFATDRRHYRQIHSQPPECRAKDAALRPKRPERSGPWSDAPGAAVRSRRFFLANDDFAIFECQSAAIRVFSLPKMGDGCSMPWRKCSKCGKRAIAYHLEQDGTRTDLCEDHVPVGDGPDPGSTEKSQQGHKLQNDKCR